MPPSFNSPYSYQAHTTSASASLALPFTVPPAIGDLVELCACVFNSAGVSAADNYGNTWALKESFINGSSSGYVWACDGITNTGAGFAATFTLTGIPRGISAAAVGTTPSSPPVFDGSSVGSGSGTALSAGTYNRQGTGAFDVGFFTTVNNGQVWTPGVPPNVLQSRAGTSSQGPGFLLTYQSNGTSGSLTPTAADTVAGAWVGIGISFSNVFFPSLVASPATIVADNPGWAVVTVTGSHTAWDSGTLATVSGVAGCSILSQSIDVPTQVITATIATGSAVGTLTIGNTTDSATTTIGVVAQPIGITPYVSTSGQVLFFVIRSATPAANGQYADAAVTAVSSDPTVTVDGSPVVLGPPTWTSTSKGDAFVCYLLPSVLSPSDIIACSWPAGWFATAVGSPLAQAGVPVANYTGQVEPDFAVSKTMKVGLNTGSQPSNGTQGNYLGKSLMGHSGAWIAGANTTIFSLDAAGFPVSWTRGGSVVVWVNGSFNSNQVDAQGLPVLMGTYAAQYDDAKVGTSDAWSVSLTGNANVVITPITTIVEGTTVTKLWNVRYAANAANLEPFIELVIQSAPGLYANPTAPNLWTFGPGSTIDRSDPLAASEVALSRFTSARGRTPEWLRSMDVDGGGFGEIDNLPFAADLIDVGHTSWNYVRAITTAALPFPMMRACNFDPAKGPVSGGGDGTYAWVTTRYYGDPTQSCYVQGPDSFGYYEPIAANDGGSSVYPPQSGAQAHCVFEVVWSQPHGLAYGYSLSISQNATAANGFADNGSGAIRVTTVLPNLFVNGQLVRVNGVVGVPNALGVFAIAVVDSTHFDLVGTTFSGTYVSGGSCYTAMPLQQNQSVAITNLDNLNVLITGPNTAIFTAFCGGTAVASTMPITLSATVELPCQYFVHGQAPHDRGNVPYEFSSALAARLGSKRWVNLPLKGTAGVYQEIARRVASRTPFGSTLPVEVGNEIWNGGFPDSQECGRLAVVAGYLPTGTKLWGNRYTVTNGVSVPGGLFGTYPLIAASAMDTFAAELIAIGRSDIKVERVLGAHFAAPTATQTLLATCVAYGLSFDWLALAPYQNLGTDAPFVTAYANGSGWTVAALCDLVKHDLYHDTVAQGWWASHAQYLAAAAPSLPGGVAPALICYEGFPQNLQPAADAAQLHDILAHPLMYNVITAYLYGCQRGQPTVDGSAPLGINLYQGATAPGGFPTGSWMLLAGLYQPPGYGLSNRFATAAGGAPADGKSHYGPSWTGNVQDFDGNESPGMQAVLDWIDATSTPVVTGPIDVVSDIGTLIVADDPAPLDEVDPDAGSLIIV